jgi:hypothetical protein
MKIKVDQEGFDALKKLCDNAMRTMGLAALKLVEDVHGNIDLEIIENGKEKKEQPENVQEKVIGKEKSQRPECL